MTQPTLMAQLVELQEENARLREDAERYRIVRDGYHGEEAGFVAVDGEALYGKKLDDYCDQYAAMEASNGNS